MATFGYWRTSTSEQNKERQTQSLVDSGCERIYGDQITGLVHMVIDLNYLNALIV